MEENKDGQRFRDGDCLMFYMHAPVSTKHTIHDGYNLDYRLVCFIMAKYKHSRCLFGTSILISPFV